MNLLCVRYSEYQTSLYTNLIFLLLYFTFLLAFISYLSSSSVCFSLFFHVYLLPFVVNIYVSVFTFRSRDMYRCSNFTNENSTFNVNTLNYSALGIHLILVYRC